MKSLLKITTCAVALAATAVMAGSFPFPQNMKSPHGYTIPFADTDMIKAHYTKWKKAWYDASRGWILSPEGTGSTVSEGIAYGMLITVYMDEQDVFDKLYGTWKSNSSNGGGMNWRVGDGAQGGTASDADFDAALALVMASKQWGGSYLNDAKSLISWIASNDINGSKIKPGNQWNDAFNPSYATTANFQLFQDVAGGSWSSVISQAYTDLNACQNSQTGLVPDWCDWNSHQPTKTNASVAQDEAPGFFDDAARTPWRMAWAYYWYGDTKAQSFNKKITKWLYDATNSTASGINSGYSVDGQAYTNEKRGFVSSTFSGGLGLAASSFDDDISKAYMETVYKALSNMESCESASGCGSSVKGEKYYPATLNLLYLLLMTGNMPNFYNMAGFEKFTPDQSLASSVSMPDGIQQAKKDSTVGISGFWNWGAYHDKLDIGTKMAPDSGSSPLFLYNGVITAEARMEIGPEPEWTQAAADAGTLKYPSAGIAMSFLSNDKKGVNFTELGVRYLEVEIKAQGPIRMAILNEKTVEAGSEPGIYVKPSASYSKITYDLKPNGYGFVGLNDYDNEFNILSWVDKEKAPSANEILTCVKGLKWEVKDAKGGFGSISIKSVKFLDANKQVIDPVLITGIEVPELVVSSSSTIIGSSNSIGPGQSSSSIYDAIVKADALSTIKVATSGLSVQILNAKLGASYAVMSIQGKVIASGKITSASHAVMLPNKGMYLVKVGSEIRPVSVK
ncbi:MAG: glycoside hydrolase [Fibrobacter sp.]|nr:glycoside hydrolase [Fibrobacter sp.]